MARAARLVILTAALMTSLAGGVTGCTTRIVPPRVEPAQSSRVLVADYGYHSTVILPDASGGLVEYAYGDWTFFAQNQKSIFGALRALFVSDQSTIGRRTLTQATADRAAFTKAIGANSVLTFDAPADKVRDLGQALDRRFTTGGESPFFSAVHNLFFVKDGEHYSVLHNCNHFTGENLVKLGCRLEGWPVLSKFELGKPDAPDNGL